MNVRPLVLLVAPENSPAAIESESQTSAWTCSLILMSPLAQRWQETEKNQVIFVELELVEDTASKEAESDDAAPVVELLVEEAESEVSSSAAPVVELKLVEDMASKASPSDAPVERGKGALKKVEAKAKTGSRKASKQPDPDSATESPKPSPPKKDTDRGEALPDAKSSDEKESSSRPGPGEGGKLSTTKTRDVGKPMDAKGGQADAEEPELPARNPPKEGNGSKAGTPWV